MGRHGDKAREALLDSAEELFGSEGVDLVSNRRITEHAGTANHSAIAYHFGSRDELLRALIARHLDPSDSRRKQLIAEMGSAPSVYDIVRSRLLPFVELLESLPRPSWRARFLFQARAVPSVVDIVRELGGFDEIGDDFDRFMAQVDGVSGDVVQSRSRLLGHLVLGVCAEFEAKVTEDTSHDDWSRLAYFLIDAATGMISAPVTGPQAPPAPEVGRAAKA